MEMGGLEKRLLMSGPWRLFTQRLALPWILGAGPLPERAQVLEIGSGAGFNAETLLRRFPRWELMATDLDPGMVDRARERLVPFGDRVRPEIADATALSEPDGSFDLVVAIMVLHHVGDWERALAECRRVLRPEGLLLVADLLRPFFVWPVGRLFPPARAYVLGDVRRGLAEAGFTRACVHGWPLWYRALAQSP
jgi:ubiquinone/menaquinone biosynthesis C-methylase UbiE